MITAEKVYRDIVQMPLKEREKLFLMIARRGFEKDLYTHYEVHDEIGGSPFTVREAADYLGVSETTLKKWIEEGKIKWKRVGKRKVIEQKEIEAFKERQANRG
ncbi:MAG: helix-turn-helix domain-containing protein [Deltaproteobacteria bacterium]|nr:helix-turn-helix domain-containing protein [Deltaproteobacteria bacterium]MBW2136971.1 helix-turn-helix domain-containing protein [Deltaproteobacteria bacterium]